MKNVKLRLKSIILLSILIPCYVISSFFVEPVVHAIAPVTTSFSGTLTTSNTFVRPVTPSDTSSNPNDYTKVFHTSDLRIISGTGSETTLNYTRNYFVRKLTPAVTGDYTIRVTGAGSLDTLLFVYIDNFDKNAPMTNVLFGNDDESGSSALSYVSVAQPLSSAHSYYIVMTTYVNGQTGNINFDVVGTGGITVVDPAAPTSTPDTTAPTGTLNINSGATATNTNSVTLGITSSDGSGVGGVEMRFSNDNSTWSTWEAAGTTKAWTLASTDGSKTVYMQLKDSAGNVITTPITKSITLDRIAPTGTLNINVGATETNTTNVTLAITSSDGSGVGGVEMRFSNDNSTWSTWEAAGTTKAWTLASTDGSNTVYMQLRDKAGNIISAPITKSITLDSTAPVVTGVIDAHVYTMDKVITFNEGSALLDGSGFTSGATVNTEGAHTLVVTDTAGNITTVHFTIDKTAPNGTLNINAGATHTQSSGVTLAITSSDGSGVGGVEMRFSNDNSTWSTWEAAVTTKAWTLASTDGSKTVYMQVRDSAGNIIFAPITKSIILDSIAPVVNGVTDAGVYTMDKIMTFNEGSALLDSSSFTSGATVNTEGAHTLVVTDLAGNITTVHFTIDKTAPTGTLNINAGVTATNTTSVTLSITSSDGSGVGGVEMRFSNDNSTWSTWEAAATTKAWTLISTDGSKTVYMQLRDSAGNAISAPITKSITLDTIAPTGTLNINVGATETNTTSVTLVITSSDGSGVGGVEMRFSNDNSTWSTWEAAVTTKAWTLASTDGSKTVYMQLRDKAGNIISAPITKSITLDSTAPVVTGVIDTHVYTMDKVIAFNEGSALLDGSSFTSGATVNTEGAHTLVVTDTAGNITTVHFTIDKTAPTGTLNINAGATATNTTSATLAITSSDGNGIGGVEMRFSNDNSTWSTWEAAGTSKAWTLASADGSKTVYMQLRDSAGNITSAPITKSIILDSIAPVVTGVTDANVYTMDKVITFNEGSALLDGSSFTSGATVNKEGTHTLVVTDTAGNITTVRFTIDKTAPTGTLNINAGATAKNTTSVTLSITSSDGSGVGGVEMRFSNDNSTWSTWEAAVTTKAWTLTSTDGSKTVYMQLKDSAGNVITAPITKNITLDTAAPTGTLNINVGATETNTTNVTLAITSSDGSGVGGVEMRFSNDNSTWSTWEAVATTKAWTLASTDGSKTVYMQLRDSAGNVTSTAITRSITLDSTAPVVSGVIDAHVYTMDKVITFNEGSALLDGSSFTSGATVNTEGAHTLVVTDTAGNITTVHFTIDKTAPSGTLNINAGETTTNTTGVTLEITSSDGSGVGGVEMRFSNDNSTWSPWEAAGTTKAWTLASTDGSETVYMELRDSAGNVISTPITKSITLDTATPTGTLNINTGATDTNTKSVTLEITSNDGSGVGGVEMRFSNDNSTWSPWEAAGTTKAWTLASTDGSKTVYMQLRDSVGNVISAPITKSITLDSTAPVVTGVTNAVFATDKVITFNEGSALLDGSNFTSGATVNTEGAHTLVVTDAAGNITTIHFTIDKTAPSGTLNINTGATATNTTSVTLAITSSDGGGVGGVEMRFSNDNSTWGTWEAAGTTKAWTLASTDGSKTVYMQLKDSAGNVITTPITKSILLDGIAPVVSGVTNKEAYNNDKVITFNEGSASLDDSSFTSGATVSAEGSHTLVVTDAAGNVTTVHFMIDKSAPVITLLGQSTIYLTSGGTFVDPGYQIVDMYDTHPDATVTGTVYASRVGSYVLLYNAVDNVGNHALEVTRTVQVVAPIVTNTVVIIPVVPPVVEKTRQVNVEVGSVNEASNAVKVDIVRKEDKDGKQIDEVKLDQKKMQEAVTQARAESKEIVRIVVDDLKDNPADQAFVTLPKDSFQTISKQKLDLEVKTDGVTVTLPSNSLSKWDSTGEDLFFRIIPIRKTEEKNQVEQRTVNSDEVRTVAGNNTVELIGTPMTIETNFQNQSVKVALPIDAKVLPTVPANLKAFLDSIAIYVEHSDGEKVLQRGKIIFNSTNMPIAIEIEITKFSTFTMITINDNVLTHEPYILGYPDGTFKPQRSITRAEVATVLARLLDSAALTTSASVPAFTDVKATSWAAQSIKSVQAAGLMTGNQNGLFHPEAPITRAEIAAIALRWMKQTASSAPASFTDTTNNWAKEIIETVKANGWMTGYADNTFGPNRSLTRAELVVTMNHLLKRGPLHGVNMPSWKDVTSSYWAYEAIEEASRKHQSTRLEDGSELIYEASNAEMK